ncbi:MAG: hypothetical protein ACR2P6_00960 [Gammaproteobacteria bacterium]
MRSRVIYRSIALLIALPFIALADATLMDPTRPYYSRQLAPAPGAEFKVTAIFYSDARQQAVVNGKLVVQGDRVDGARVMKIRPDALDLLFRGESITRRLPAVKLRNK